MSLPALNDVERDTLRKIVSTTGEKLNVVDPESDPKSNDSDAILFRKWLRKLHLKTNP